MTHIERGERIARTAHVRLCTSAVILDPAGTGVLLTRRADNGQWCLPGGALDPGETAAECCEREVLEETGLHVRVTRLTGVYSDPHMIMAYADGNRWHIVDLNFAAEVQGGTPGLSEETTQIGYFTPAEIAQMDLLEHHRQRITDALLGQQVAFIR